MKITRRQLLLAIRKTGGNLSAVARLYGMTRQGVAKRVNASPSLKRAMGSVVESTLDVAEEGLKAAIEKQSPWAIKFFLATRGRARGYAKTLSVETDEKPGIIHMYFPDDGRDKPDTLNVPALPTPEQEPKGAIQNRPHGT